MSKESPTSRATEHALDNRCGHFNPQATHDEGMLFTAGADGAILALKRSGANAYDLATAEAVYSDVQCVPRLAAPLGFEQNDAKVLLPQVVVPQPCPAVAARRWRRGRQRS